MKTAEEWVKEFDKTPQYYADYMGELVTAIQSDAIESTVRECAKIASRGFRINDEKSYSTAKHIEEKILSLIPQKEKKV